jgi:ectoine hydrolase
VKLPFERSEYLERLGKTKQRMEEAGIDVLLISNEHNMNYLSGYDGYSSYVPQFLMVAGDEEEPLWVGRAMDEACARNSIFMDHSRIVGYPERYIGDPNLHPMVFMADLLQIGRAHV